MISNEMIIKSIIDLFAVVCSVYELWYKYIINYDNRFEISITLNIVTNWRVKKRDYAIKKNHHKF